MVKNLIRVEMLTPLPLMENTTHITTHMPPVPLQSLALHFETKSLLRHTWIRWWHSGGVRGCDAGSGGNDGGDINVEVMVDTTTPTTMMIMMQKMIDNDRCWEINWWWRSSVVHVSKTTIPRPRRDCRSNPKDFRPRCIKDAPLHQIQDQSPDRVSLFEATTKTNNTGNFAFQGVYPTLEYYEVFKSRSVWWSGQYKREMKRQLEISTQIIQISCLLYHADSK